MVVIIAAWPNTELFERNSFHSYGRITNVKAFDLPIRVPCDTVLNGWPQRAQRASTFTLCFPCSQSCIKHSIFNKFALFLRGVHEEERKRASGRFFFSVRTCVCVFGYSIHAESVHFEKVKKNKQQQQQRLILLESEKHDTFETENSIHTVCYSSK